MKLEYLQNESRQVMLQACFVFLFLSKIRLHTEVKSSFRGVVKEKPLRWHMLSSPWCPHWEARSPIWAQHHPLLSGQLSLVPCSEHNITVWSLPSRLTIQAGETVCSDTLLNKLQKYKREAKSNPRKQHQKRSKSMMANWPNLRPIKIIFLPKTTNALVVTMVPKQAAW